LSRTVKNTTNLRLSLSLQAKAAGLAGDSEAESGGLSYVALDLTTEELLPKNMTDKYLCIEIHLSSINTDYYRRCSEGHFCKVKRWIQLGILYIYIYRNTHKCYVSHSLMSLLPLSHG